MDFVHYINLKILKIHLLKDHFQAFSFILFAIFYFKDFLRKLLKL